SQRFVANRSDRSRNGQNGRFRLSRPETPVRLGSAHGPADAEVAFALTGKECSAMPSRTSSARYAVPIHAVLVVWLLFRAAPLEAQELKWVRQFGTIRVDKALAVAKGPTGVYVTGHTVGVFPGQSSAGDVDVFVSRYDELGSALWTRQFGSTTVAEDQGTGVATDQTAVYV